MIVITCYVHHTMRTKHVEDASILLRNITMQHLNGIKVHGYNHLDTLVKFL
jgi:hypothetical protein